MDRKTQSQGLEYLPYKFTAKELDEETGLYYYGARYLDPKYSMWISTDPALGEYIPAAGKADSQNSANLPGMGGVFNHINGNLYHYAGNNPVKYTDPDGRIQIAVQSFYKQNQEGTDWAKPNYTIRNTEWSFVKNGCAITAAANFAESNGLNLSPIDVNNKYTTEKGYMNFEKLGKDNGFSVKKVDSSFTMKKYLEQSADTKNEYSTLLKVDYNGEGKEHWVGLEGMISLDGTDYAIISNTSINDDNTRDGSARNFNGWKNFHGKTIVPVSQIEGYVNFIKARGENNE